MTCSFDGEDIPLRSARRFGQKGIPNDLAWPIHGPSRLIPLPLLAESTSRDEPHSMASRHRTWAASLMSRHPVLSPATLVVK